MNLAASIRQPVLGGHRWLSVAAASVFINTSYGAMSYSFSVFVTRSAMGGEFGTGAVALGFSLALLVSGVVAIAAGAVSDVFGVRRMLAAGSVLGATALVLLSQCREPWQAILVMACLMGPAMAATFYEPVYVLMNRWFTPAERPRAYGLLTLLSGTSVSIFTPLTRLFVDAWAWDGALLGLASILLVVGLIVPALLPEGSLPSSGGGAGGVASSVRGLGSDLLDGLRHTSRGFWAFSAAFFVATAAFSGFSFHMISQLETRGFDESAVAGAIGATGLVSLPLRLGLPVLSARVSGSTLLASCLVVLAGASWLASMTASWWQVWLYVGVFGAVFGAVYPLRALAGSERFAGPYFGRLLGIQALLVALGRALGPLTIAAIGTDRAGYELGFRLAAFVLAGAAIAGWVALRSMPKAAA